VSRIGRITIALTVCASAIQAADTAPTDRIWKDLSAGNQRFIAGAPQPRDIVGRRQELVNIQRPRVAVLSCADSRVPPELVFDQSLGDLFVVRSAGESADALALGSLEYAVKHLGTSMIVVMGHQYCGAVKAACSGERPESPNLEAVVAPIASSCLRKADDPGSLDWATRQHVHQVAQDLLGKSEILKKAAQEGKLSIVEAYYSLDSGEAMRLR
jgi:carbonic anhydrase